MKIAIVRLSAMGDIINSAFLLQHIKTAYPDAVIDWFCEASFAPLLEGHNLLNRVHTVNLKVIKREKSLRKLIALIKKLRALGPYDKVIDLQGLVKSAVIAKFLGKERFGFAKDSIREPFASRFYTDRCTISYAENSIWRSAVLVNFALNTAITAEDITQKQPALTVKPFSDLDYLISQPTVLFVVGSSQAYKNYPVEKIAQTIDLFASKVLLIWGSLHEYEDAKKVAALSPQAVIAPKLTLTELTYLVSRCNLLIGNDTGPTHLAWALNRPSITLFGATPASKMMWQTADNIAIESSSEVNPLKLNKEDFSIAEIHPGLIFESAQRLLDAAR